MTQQEVGKLIYTIKATYPNSFKNFNNRDFENMIRVWQALLSDYAYSDVSNGLMAYLKGDTKGFPPSPGQIIDCTEKAQKKNYWAELEARVIAKDRLIGEIND